MDSGSTHSPASYDGFLSCTKNCARGFLFLARNAARLASCQCCDCLPCIIPKYPRKLKL